MKFPAETSQPQQQAPQAAVPPPPPRLLQAGEVLSYVQAVYERIYVNPVWVRRLDRNSVVRALLFLNDRRMMKAYLDKIKPAGKVWMLAHVYGDLVKQVAAKVGPAGQLWLCDATPIQVARAKSKLAHAPQAGVWHADAACFSPPGAPDLICSFFLLHEVPEEKKREIVDNVLRHLSAHGGEALFVDYHNPSWWQPVRYILLAVNRWLEPFSGALWKNAISSYASHPDDFVWEKRTLFANVYQMVTVRRKPD
ncbi:MAG: rhodoquinone biosynthesis methyltransferase RquA [Burkholderiaceae bacterium]|jgi:SAM-dependent methyltransferase|nr:rhodoquinone biosynthesis methyltransferase RquA [Burkholderiaceae bacterium]